MMADVHASDLDPLVSPHSLREGSDLTSFEVKCPHCRDGEEILGVVLSAEDPKCHTCGAKLRLRVIDDPDGLFIGLSKAFGASKNALKKGALDVGDLREYADERLFMEASDEGRPVVRIRVEGRPISSSFDSLFVAVSVEALPVRARAHCRRTLPDDCGYRTMLFAGSDARECPECGSNLRVETHSVVYQGVEASV